MLSEVKRIKSDGSVGWISTVWRGCLVGKSRLPHCAFSSRFPDNPSITAQFLRRSSLLTRFPAGWGRSDGGGLLFEGIMIADRRSTYRFP
jgi:hypothetical protein